MFTYILFLIVIFISIFVFHLLWVQTYYDKQSKNDTYLTIINKTDINLRILVLEIICLLFYWIRKVSSKL